jgi:hypothetical protein
MAFLETGWGKTTVALNQPIQTLQNGVIVGAPTFYSYQSSTDNLATIGGADYFLDKSFELCVGDVIYCDGSDAASFRSVTTLTNTNVVTSALATSGAVGTANIDALAVTAAKLAADAVTTTKILDDAVTSAKISPEVVQYVKVSLSAVNFLGMYATPIVLVAAGGANTLHVVERIAFEVDYGGAQFAAGGAVLCQYDSTANGAGAPASATTAAATFNAIAADGVVGAAGSLASATAANTVNKGLYLSNQTAAFTTGSSTVDVHIWYSTVTTTF